MAHITYQPLAANNSISSQEVHVLLDGKRVGRILQVPTGYQYKPNGGAPGAVFPTVAQVKLSIEGTSDGQVQLL